MKSLFQLAVLSTALALSLSACTQSNSITERAKKFENATNYSMARKIYSEGLKTDPDNPVYLWRRAYACLESGAIDETLAYCDRQLKIDPYDPSVLLLKARCYQFLRFQELPKRLYEQALALSPSDKTLEEKLLIMYGFGCLRKEDELEKIIKAILEECKFPKAAREFAVKGTALMGLARFDEARETFKSGLRKYPNAPALNLNMAILYGIQANYKKCQDYSKIAIKLKGNLLWAKAIAGASHYYNGDYEQSIKLFDEVLRQQPNYLSLRYLRMEAYAHLKNIDDAINEMEMILSIEPDNTWAVTTMSTAYRVVGDKIAATQILVDRLDSMPGNSDLSVALAKDYILADNQSEAVSILDRVIERDPNFADAYYNRARSNKISKYYEEALKDILTAIAKDKQVGCYYSLKAEILKSLGKYKEALTSAQIYSEFFPWDKYSNCLLAECYVYNRQFHKAVKVASEGLKENPDYHNLQFTRSIAYGMLDEEEKENNDFEKSTSCPDHDKASWYYSRGVFYRQLGRYKKAIKALTKAISLNSNNEYSWCARGCSYYKIGEYKKAISDCSKSLSINSNRVHPLISRGGSYREVGELDKSLSDLNKASEWAPKSGEVLYERSLLYMKLSRPELAKADFKRAEELGYRPDKI